MQSTTTKCRVCGSTSFAEGRVEDAGFKVKIPMRRVVLTDVVVMSATACLQCGHVSLRVDPDKVCAILGEPEQ